MSQRGQALTSAGLGALDAKDGRRTDYADEGRRGVRGLVLRVSPSGARSWVVRYSYRGQDRRFTIGPCKLRDLDVGYTLAEARKEARAILGLVARGADPQGERMEARRAPFDPPTR